MMVLDGKMHFPDQIGKDGWRVELSHNSSGGRGGRSGGSDFQCYECGEPGHFARECRLRVGSQGCQSHTPRSSRSTSNGQRSFTMASPRRSLTPTCWRATQMDPEEQNNRIVELENQLSELKNQMSDLKNLVAQQIHCFDQIKELSLPSPQAKVTASASAPKELDVGSNGRAVLKDGPSNAPDLEELNPVIPMIVARREEETIKRLAKVVRLSERTKQARLLERSKRRAKLGEKLRLLERLEVLGTEDLSYYTEFKVPETFEMPEFNRYDGFGNPIVHLNHFMMKMASYAENAPLMIRAFEESLTGPALQWFYCRKIHMLDTWEEVSDAFLQLYEFNLVFTPTRDVLARAEMKRGESFGAYARRWHSLAAEVLPALSDEEMVKLFLRTLPSEYRSRMIGSFCGTFSNLVMVGDEVEGAIRDGQLAA
ncbi:uncharacterized protein LOC115748812 isoform X2 [Rhodamnia argentea]|uniref:Uncharacterized protein LOC115748812 isoform X2 n=1 Tax=Rhodamnia argentea TaxID=178133 RepID=A0A8B8Q2L7_9MYRT|nr:uncharacterized protein LOC115748812 isoform X2 [Rhodamnia argentea]XP_048133299.1 uncharacterized protein LOC115748812 isoform X2 [Rhodamnia argentea]